MKIHYVLATDPEELRGEGARPAVESSAEAREGDVRSPGAVQSTPLRVVREVDKACKTMSV